MLAPTAAKAVVADVNTNGDAPDMQADMSCDAAPAEGEQCTLRAAIQTVNAGSDFSNTITFHHLPPGQHTITLGSQLPDIVKPAFVSGNGVACGSSFTPAPCVEVTYAAASGLPVLSFNLSSPPQGGQLIGAQALALTNGSVGLRITGQTRDMRVTNMWLGLHLDATPGSNGVGVSVEGNSADGTVIGGESAGSRNVIAFNTMSGIDISAADDTLILGNYIGSKPDGITQAGNGSASTNGENIEVTSNAENTQIGATLAAEAAASRPCDGGCNVIIDAGRDVVNNYAPHIDLRGETASGEGESSGTTIRGNYIGLARDGTTSISRGTRGIAVAVNASDGVMIGGPAPGDRNRFHNNGTIVANNSGADDLVVRNNWVNLEFDGTAVDPDGLHHGIGMNLSGSDLSPPLITENRIAWAATSNFPAISAHNESFVITNNVIGRAVGGAEVPGGGIGINIGNLSGATTRTLVSGNTVDGVASGSSVVPAAILVTSSDGADFVGNVLDASGAETGADGDGIRIEGTGSSGNVIGGNDMEATNTITADRDAIRVVDAGALSNTFGRNVGTADADEAEAAQGSDLFIDLGADGFLNNTSANGGIEAPEVEVAGASVVAGEADPETTIRVFTRPVDGDREAVGAFLGSTTANATGDWRLDYATPQAEGVPVAATQTDGNGNSSELSPSVLTDATPPSAPSITSGPAGPTTDTTPAFAFSTSEGGGTLLCSLDQGPAQACDEGAFDVASPLADGPHAFRVIHEDLAGNPSAAASRDFVVDTRAGRPRISGPSGLIRDRTPTFSLVVEDGATVTCTLDGAPLACTASGFTAGPLGDGAHTVTVTQTDAAGNVSAPEARSVRVDATPPQTLRLRGRISPFDRTPTFRFRSSEPGSTFRCKLNGGRWRACRSPHTLRRTPMRLTRPNVLRVRAVDRAGNPDPTPLRRVFRVRIRGAA